MVTSGRALPAIVLDASYLAALRMHCRPAPRRKSMGNTRHLAATARALAANNPKDGLARYAGLALDKSGNLHGTTRSGGGKVTGGSTVYKLTPTSKGEWSETVIHAFPAPRYHDGKFVLTGVTLDAAGNLYGATTFGGGRQESTCDDFDGCGIVYKLSPNSDGTWRESILHAFHNGRDGSEPELDRLLVDSAGNVYGTTYLGGSGVGGGTVFEITP